MVLISFLQGSSFAQCQHSPTSLPKASLDKFGKYERQLMMIGSIIPSTETCGVVRGPHMGHACVPAVRECSCPNAPLGRDGTMQCPNRGMPEEATQAASSTRWGTLGDQRA